MNQNPDFSELLVQDVPPALIRQILDVLPSVYPDAYDEVHGHEKLGEPEAKSVLGYLRRGFFEMQFRNIATECGLRVDMHTPTNGGCEHVQVICGRFRLIACHVQSPGAFPQHSDCREQYAGVNEHIAQTDWLAKPSQPGEQSIFGVLTHTSERHDPRQFRCAQIGFPDPDFERWVDKPVELLDLRDKQMRAYQAQEDLQGRNQDPKPKWKKRQDDNQESELPGDDT